MADRMIRILVVDDEPPHAAAVERAFRSEPSVVVEVVSTLAGFRNVVEHAQPDLALVDLNLPDGRAVELLTSPPEDGAFPIVVMTSHGNEQTAVEAMKAGAVDYVVKSSAAFAELPHTLGRALREWQLRRERRDALDALRESEQRHRTIFDRSHDALMTLAPPEWRYGSGNAAALALFGAVDESEFLQQTPWSYSPERQSDDQDSASKARSLLTQAMREGALLFEWTHRRATGETFPATVLLTRIDINGLAQLQATVRDDSEKQRMRASVAQADRLASMGMLAAGVAHEINNPLAYVLYNVDSLAQELPRLTNVVQRCCLALREQIGEPAFAQIVGSDADLLDPHLLADAVERIKEALEGTQRIRAIARGLGTFSRVERVERSNIDLRLPLEAAINMAHNELRHRARLVRDLGPVPAVSATEGKLSQVFLNLLVNAAHAIDEGNVQHHRIAIRTWTEGSAACVSISDTGKGIPSESIERIFEPFFTTKPVGVGSGLGLSICKSIIGEFDGMLTVQSEVGRGTRFVVKLPAAQSIEVSARTSTVTDSPATAAARGRILVVDDEVSILKAVSRLLGGDHDLVTANSGIQARDLVALDAKFDLVLCDVIMPHMSGVELHAWLCSNYPRLARQTVFLTGGTFTPKATEYLAGVGNLKIEKPFDLEALKRIVSDRVVAAGNERDTPLT